jgi:ribosomal protein S20
MTADQPSGADSDGKRSSVKVRLTSNRRRRSVENDEYASFIRRILRAYSRRVADGDVEALILMTSLADELDTAIAETVKGLRDCGYSWAEIGSRLGITRQAAQQRWGTP